MSDWTSTKLIFVCPRGSCEQLRLDLSGPEDWPCPQDHLHILSSLMPRPGLTAHQRLNILQNAGELVARFRKDHNWPDFVPPGLRDIEDWLTGKDRTTPDVAFSIPRLAPITPDDLETHFPGHVGSGYWQADPERRTDFERGRLGPNSLSLAKIGIRFPPDRIHLTDLISPNPENRAFAISWRTIDNRIDSLGEFLAPVLGRHEARALEISEFEDGGLQINLHNTNNSNKLRFYYHEKRSGRISWVRKVVEDPDFPIELP